MSSQRDRLWEDWLDHPTDAQFEREVEQANREARRTLAARRRAENREFRRDVLYVLLGMAIAILVIWLIAPAFVQQ